MTLASFLRAFRAPAASTTDQPYKANTSSLPSRLKAVFSRTWDLGFTAFGGPPVHFAILHQRFVKGVSARSTTRVKHVPWIDEQTYQEIFAVCQALPGPASTKMGFCITLVHAGLIPALFQYIMWAGPGAVGMFALALGIKKVGDTLPSIVYALLSGLNSATVGIVALAAVQLAEKAITDQTSRLLVIVGACAGLCYNALWYFPVLMVLAGLVALTWDMWARGAIGRFKERRKRRKEQRASQTQETPTTDTAESVKLDNITPGSTGTDTNGPQLRRPIVGDEEIQRDVESQEALTTNPKSESLATEDENTQGANGWNSVEGTDMLAHAISLKVGIAIIVSFFLSFIAVLTIRGAMDKPPLELNIFSNMYLAGTIIFGGGPVVIPLLRSYVVDPGWVSPRDFLLGLAIIQAFPGPNFNFAVFLGALALSSTSYASPAASSFLGAFLSFIGIFAPGMILAVGVQSIWRVLRRRPSVKSILRGVNAGAVGLVFTAVYRLWEIGWLTEEASKGRSLGGDPWWVVIAASTFAGVRWFGIPPPVGIILGGLAGMAWWGVVKS
ncbi:chromate transporter-domain-containing protein [Peziza echinospora]|nr:chromate transporter-domain-containing protein [Peziza echinospora]